VAKSVHFKVADMRRIASSLKGQRFDGITNLFTSFGYYDDDTNDDILRQCGSLVRPRGFFALEIMNRDWLVRNFQPRGFTRYKGLILLEERKFDVETSLVQATWTFLKQRSKKQFVLEKQVTIDTRIWSLHELVETFRKNGWKFRAAYAGFGRQDEDVALTEAHRLLFIAKRSDTH
jgi:SAM-dependent methyltransferase